MITNTNEYMTGKEAAELLGVTPSALTNWGNRGIIERTKILGTNVYHKDEVERMRQRLANRERARYLKAVRQRDEAQKVIDELTKGN